ncbi:hypothetical protein [Chishuiella sp.]|uniref:hypothetical protein n=1 Tax=Chishuiella sp. TaxID=1969467 RepID=UPI0028AB31E7|nr:hypothetical protein [Chishuiella sp.]
MKQFIVMTLFRLGDFVSRTKLMNYEFGADFYNFLMVKSSKLQDKWNLKEPWGEAEN